jgi:molecular chaperone HtpG
MQDSALVQKLNRLLTKRFLKHLASQAKNEPEKYQEFFERFGRFLKEGIATAPEHHEALGGLLRFESSMLEKGEKTSLADYLTRAKEEQEEIYYLVGLDRDAMTAGPYLEAFQKRGIEVALFTDQIDDYIMETLREFKGKKLVSADRAEIELDDLVESKSKLSEEDGNSLVEWLTTTLGDKVEKVELGKRLVSHPVVALQSQDAPSGQVRAMMEAMGENAPEQKARLEFNPNHELVAKLHALKGENEEVAAKVANQLADNALLAAGLVKNPAGVVAGMNDLLGSLMK